MTPPRPRRTWLLFPLTLGLACTPTARDDDSLSETGGDGVWLSLIDPTAWVPTHANDDPAADHRPERIDCIGGYAPEGAGIEVSTDQCNYLSISQPIAVPIAAGEAMRIQTWWQSLASTMPAQGHIALFVDDDLQWEEFVAIPGPADARDIRWAADHDISAGATITLHLHNHGANTWQFNDFSVLQSAP